MRVQLLLNTISQRVITSVTTVPVGGWKPILSITAFTTIGAGVGSIGTGFINPLEDYSPPSTIWRPLIAFIVPGLLEELIWRAALIPIPPPPTTTTTSITSVTTIIQHFTNPSSAIIAPPTLTMYKTALAVLIIHVISHPFFSASVYPRGKEVFGDPRFLFLATIVLSGTTLSYIVSGGSVWAAAFTHGLPVALWRDVFGGENALQRGAGTKGGGEGMKKK